MREFHDVRFPVAISFGATGGPERRVEIVEMSSGHERRNLRLSASRRRFDAGTGLRSLEDLQEIVAFFEARRGAFHAFRFRDPFDMKSCAAFGQPASLDQRIGTGDGSQLSFQLVKRYGAGEDAYERAITRPVAASVRIAVGGNEVAPADFSVDHAGGRVTLAPGIVPPPGAAVTAGYEFDIAARFDTDAISVSLASFRAGQIPAIPIMEVLEP